MYRQNGQNRRALLLGVAGTMSGFMVSGLLAGCGGGGGSTAADPNPPLMTRGQYGALQFILSTTRSTFAVGEKVPFVFTITNTGSEPIVFGDAAPMYTAHIAQGNTLVWDRYYGYGFGAGYRDATLAPGESRRHEFSWQQKNSGFQETPEVQVAPGTYRVTVFAGLKLGGVNDPENQLAVAPMNSPPEQVPRYL